MNPAFPKARDIWNRAILGGIVNAIMTAQSIGFECFECWSGNHFLLNGGDGRDGIITFAGGHWYPDAPFVGLFHDVHSDLFNSEAELDLNEFFIGCPSYQRQLAEQRGLEYLQLEYDGRLLHRVTAAFWDYEGSVSATTPWAALLDNGVSLFHEAVNPNLTQAIETFVDAYQMTAEQTKLAKQLYEAKIASPPRQITLANAQADFLKSSFKDPKETYAKLDQILSGSQTETNESKEEWWNNIDTYAEFEKAMRASRTHFIEMGIEFPE